MSKPPYRFCWQCNRQFHGNHFATIETETGLVYVHKQCAREMEKSGLIDKVSK